VAAEAVGTAVADAVLPVALKWNCPGNPGKPLAALTSVINADNVNKSTAFNHQQRQLLLQQH